MTREQAMKIRPGDMLRPDPLWNATERDHRKIPDPVAVNCVHRVRVSQTGIMFSVRSKGGHLLKLDAGWFLGSE